MNKNQNSMFLFIFYLLIPSYLTDLTGLHYLFTINCSSEELYIPQGPYLFSHHWPFTSIDVQYQRQINHGTCQRDGSLNFFLNNAKFCVGNYQDGQADLFCQYENDNDTDYCLIDMHTSDGSPLTCA